MRISDWSSDVCSSDLSMPQEEINALLIREAKAGHDVVRLKGGDPYIFGRGGEEAEECRAAGVPVEVVPGISAAIGCAAEAQLPLTHRDAASAVTFVDRTSVVSGKGVSVRVDIGGGLIIKK